MHCSSCSHDNLEGQSFCAECGAPLGVECPACRARNDANVKFCGSCGAALSVFGWSVPAPAPLIHSRPESFVDGRYKVIRLLGEGSSKTVYLAHDEKIGREVAFALIKTEGLDASGRERIAREARAMGKLGDNPYVVSIYDAGEERGRPFIVSQYMAGGSVDDLLRRSSNHRIAAGDAMRIACDVCRALSHAHSRGIIHRDLKPANVWLTGDGTCKLGDFGLAIATDRSRLTAAGMIVGTAAYMPPEQALGKRLDARSDLYSLGAMLYQMVTAQPPFHGRDLLAVVAQHVNAQPDPPSKKAPGIPPALDAIILELLKKTPDERPRDAAAVRARLEAMMVPASSTIDDVAASVVMERPDLNAHAAPDGTVSILFSDLENSTMMTERLGDLRAQRLLHEHNDLVRKQIAEHRGFEVKSLGDGFMIAFSSARRALLCAIGIQRGFAAYSRQHRDEPIRVRIGLHTGEAILEKGDFFGKNVILAARIAAKAAAGEILVSSIFKAVTETAGDLRFDDGHDVELKGLSGSYRVYRALWSAGEVDGGAASDEPAQATATGASRRTGESPRPAFSRNIIWPVAGAVAALAIVGLIAFKLMRTPPPPEATQPVPSGAVEQSASNPQLPPAASVPQPPETIQPQTNAAVIVSPEERAQALATVGDWLSLLDQGRYPMAWDQSTFLLPKEEWVQNVRTLRARRGRPISRKLESEEPSPARNPKRMLFRYQTEFERGRPATELVYTIPRPNGHWVITGYWIKVQPNAAAPPDIAPPPNPAAAQ